MPRYIDADELIKAAEKVPYGNDIAIERFKSFVNQNAKVEDVAPVVHAHLVDIGTANGHEDISAGICSACELVSTWFADSRKPEKCSHCGAIME